MELTGLRHTLNIGSDTLQISEPVGFDKLSVKMKRGDYHGISAEYSDTTLGFYEEAAALIDECYHTDIDTPIRYDVLLSNGQTLYSGYIDLTTYSRKSGKRNVVECKVAEIGAKTIFNNRVDTEVNLNTRTTIDGAALDLQQNWQSIKIPVKHLKYTNVLLQNEDSSISGDALFNDGYIRFSLNNESISEFGELKNTFISYSYPNLELNGYHFYNDGSDFIEKYGSGTEKHIAFNLKSKIKMNAWMRGDIRKVYFYYYFVIKNSSFNIILQSQINKETFDYGDSSQRVRDFNFSGSIDNTSETFYIYVHIKVDTDVVYGGYLDDRNVSFEWTINDSSSIKMLMYDNLTDTDIHADMLLVHDALNIISQAISENALTVKSDWYAHKDSIANPSIKEVGYGALKALTNGYKIRGLFTDNQIERNMPLSFKDAIKSLNVLDCIGWGFNDEDGQTFVRVEPWNWFYKDEVLLTINNANSKTRTLEMDDILTKLTIGYKKYATSDEYNSIDSVHGERTFVSSIKAISKDDEQLCEFIADNYAIEETRRAREQVDASEEFKYDENIFVFELAKMINLQAHTEELYVPNSAINAEGIARPSEFINAKLSPRWCAARWASYLFRAYSNSAMKFSTGTINYKAAFGLGQYMAIQGTRRFYGLLPVNGYGETEAAPKTAEDANIDNSHCMLVAEKVEIEYPISTIQYQDIKANPYGRVVVDGEYFWIKNFEYELKTGLAKFTLIPQYIEPQN